MYEALAEIMYPLPESLSASILVQWINVVTLVFLFVAPNRGTLVNFLVLIVMAVCIVLVLLTPYSYKRRDEDERKRIEKEQNLIIGGNNLNQPTADTVDERQYGTFGDTNSERRFCDRSLNEFSDTWRGVNND